MQIQAEPLTQLTSRNFAVSGGTHADRRRDAIDPQSGGIGFEADANTQPMNTDTDACTNACTSETHLEHADNNEHNFSQALAMIAELPLTYDEKAKAVRRLLAQDKAE